ncbi:MAG: ribosomal protein L7/L12 [Acidobacteriota bacterium]
MECEHYATIGCIAYTYCRITIVVPDLDGSVNESEPTIRAGELSVERLRVARRGAILSASLTPDGNTMPTNYTCSECGLETIVGAFHTFSDGYAWRVLCMCRYCGMTHRIDIATRWSEDTEARRDFRVCDLKLRSAGHNRVRVMKELRELLGCSLEAAKQAIGTKDFTIKSRVYWHEAEATRKHFKTFGADAEVVVLEEADLGCPVPKVRDRLLTQPEPGVVTADWKECEVRGPRSKPEGRFELLRQHCGHCGA